MSLKILVKNCDGKDVALDVEPSDTIEEVKTKIQNSGDATPNQLVIRMVETEEAASQPIDQPSTRFYTHHTVASLLWRADFERCMMKRKNNFSIPPGEVLRKRQQSQSNVSASKKNYWNQCLRFTIPEYQHPKHTKSLLEKRNLFDIEQYLIEKRKGWQG
mmetsp:Transcript_11571/g.25840  ORF Transcript_11571/g.25840 Transcript_11571/m.25840 type:complete len:160 (+) Transcript_11571:57-536(+)